MQTKKIVFSDLYQEENSKVMLSVLTPLIVIQRNEKLVVGVILMRIEPYQFLYPLIKSWPTPSLTGETELIRREGNEVVFLNELRHRKNIPLNLRLPLTSANLPEAKFVRGKQGIVEGLDYRGVPVLAAVGRIPDSPWFLVAKIDADEIYAPLKKRSWEVGSFFFTLIVCTGICVAYFWRNQQIRFYRKEYKVERERRALAQRYEYLTRYANDIILVADQNLKIVEANNKSIDSYGYGREELLTLNLIDLYESGKEKFLDSVMRHVEQKDGLVFEAQQRRKDGTTFSAEVSLRLLEVEGEKLFQEIIRDITERKRAEKEIRESEKNLRHLASQLLRAQEDERKRISMELHDEMGHALLTLKLQLKSVEEQLSPQQVSLRAEVSKMFAGIGATLEGVRRLYHDLSPGDLEDLGLTMALRSLVDDFANLQKHIKWTIEMDSLDGLFPLSTQTAVYRVVQEALTNIGKHANPKHVTLKIKQEGQEISFGIEDDGVGFERNQIVSGEKTLGLLTMEERVRILGGSFKLWSSANQGTRIAFSIPIAGGDQIE
jgi:PAS domain S-box-containing protein